MKTRIARLVFVASLALGLLASAPTAFAQEHGDGESEAHGGSSFIGGPDWDDAKEVTMWSLVAIGGGSVILGALYLFKRKIGGFPEHPSWVAPISIMRASDLPGDDGAGHNDGHDPHGSHAPAH